MKNTLVIHPYDDTTHFLCNIYKRNMHKCDVVRSPDINIDRIKQQMSDPRYKRVIMCGHGSPNGLFGMNKDGYLINHSCADILKNIPDVIGIWCNADKFFDMHMIPGFYSGMFISEVGEANMFDIFPSKKEVKESNLAFANILGTHLFMESLEDRYFHVRNIYSACNGDVVKFNSSRLFMREIKHDTVIEYSPVDRPVDNF